MSELLFVYGTLRNKNEPTVKTVRKFGLYCDGSIPYMVEDEKRIHVIGNLILISDFDIYDEFEAEGIFYFRRKIEVKDCNGNIHWVWAYIVPSIKHPTEYWRKLLIAINLIHIDSGNYYKKDNK